MSESLSGNQPAVAALQPLLTVEQVANTLSLHPHTVLRALANQIKIPLPPSFKLGGRWRFRQDEVCKFIDELSGKTSALSKNEQADDTSPILTQGTKLSGRPRKVACVPGQAGAA